ncbi:HdaA/DnaA family protein [Sphingomicrobium astaxanthinifaciens]|uniref:HdaA/DnaA family protein n=1 Tax=Sphingomicrobium astaxanthinifaciens TaxID=1227949 RepID=UPI001FCC65FD|nr:chromosomal replication initiator DnaA [Sphingomicrobium astaxanthinifaciens]MCJ7422224.1 chromosomal replication initiator DnaA [Sphingomicrobium astaxanthinifaciens]
MAPAQIALPLDWPQGDATRRFITSDANRLAVAGLAGWRDWPVRAAILTGPRRSGRSLLARIFAAEVDGRVFDDAQDHDEEALFHAWNRAQEEARPLLLVADESPPHWAPALPDLATRLAASPVWRIEAPDDTLLAALFALHFADRGLALPPEAQAYLVARAERSYWEVERLVEAIDRFAIAERARITVPTIRRALEARGQAA